MPLPLYSQLAAGGDIEDTSTFVVGAPVVFDLPDAGPTRAHVLRLVTPAQSPSCVRG